MSNALAYGSTRSTHIPTGTKVMCVIHKFVEEHVSPRTGKLKPFKNLTKVVSGSVVSDSGYRVLVKVVSKSGRAEIMSFFPHEVTVDSPEILNTFRNPLGG